MSKKTIKMLKKHIKNGLKPMTIPIMLKSSLGDLI